MIASAGHQRAPAEGQKASELTAQGLKTRAVPASRNLSDRQVDQMVSAPGFADLP